MKGMPPTLISPDRGLGCLFGGALGDAWDSTYEHAGLMGGGHRPWRFTDDSQLTVATCEAILSSGTVEAEDMAERFSAWFAAGRLSGLGASTLKALRDLSVGAHWALSGARGERAAGNGAAMRIAPVAFLLDPDSPHDRQVIRDVCRITHHHDEAYVAALAVVMAVQHGLAGQLAPLSTIANRLPDSRVRDRLLELAGIGARSVADVAATFGGSGFAAESVPLALYAASGLSDCGFEGVLAEVMTVDGDTDTIASIAGQVMGARIGYAALPASLLDRLPQWADLETFRVFTAWATTPRNGAYDQRMRRYGQRK